MLVWLHWIECDQTGIGSAMIPEGSGTTFGSARRVVPGVAERVKFPDVLGSTTTMKHDDEEDREEYGDLDVQGADSGAERENAVDNKLAKIDDKLERIDEKTREMQEQIAEVLDDGEGGRDEQDFSDGEQEGSPNSEDPDAEQSVTYPTVGDLVLVTQGSTAGPVRRVGERGIVVAVEREVEPDETSYMVLFRSGQKGRYEERNLVVLESRESVRTDTGRTIRERFFRSPMYGV